jgi:hypothetical protein
MVAVDVVVLLVQVGTQRITQQVVEDPQFVYQVQRPIWLLLVEVVALRIVNVVMVVVEQQVTVALAVEHKLRVELVRRQATDTQEQMALLT